MIYLLLSMILNQLAVRRYFELLKDELAWVPPELGAARANLAHQ